MKWSKVDGTMAQRLDHWDGMGLDLRCGYRTIPQTQTRVKLDVLLEWKSYWTDSSSQDGGVVPNHSSAQKLEIGG